MKRRMGWQIVLLPEVCEDRYGGILFFQYPELDFSGRGGSQSPG